MIVYRCSPECQTDDAGNCAHGVTPVFDVPTTPPPLEPELQALADAMHRVAHGGANCPYYGQRDFCPYWSLARSHAQAFLEAHHG